jgi:hypothetical protein
MESSRKRNPLRFTYVAAEVLWMAKVRLARSFGDRYHIQRPARASLLLLEVLDVTHIRPFAVPGQAISHEVLLRWSLSRL